MARNLRWIVFLPAAILAFASPAQADVYTENFDDQSYDLSVQFAGGAFWCNTYANQYGTEGPSLCLFNTQGPTEFTFPLPVQGFQFVAGAKNGTTNAVVVYTDGTSAVVPIDGTCCETTVSFVASEGMEIERFSVPADWDLWLFDSLSWWGESSTTTTTESSTTTTTVETTTTTTSTTTSSTSTTVPAPPPASPTTEETVAPSTTFPETTVPETTTTVIQTTTTVAQTTTSVPATTTVVDTTVAAPAVTEPAPAETVPMFDIVEPEADASFEEKQEFESKVDVYSGEYEDYVPAGSTITVAQRRTVVAVTAVLIMFAPPPTRRRP